MPGALLSQLDVAVERLTGQDRHQRHDFRTLVLQLQCAVRPAETAETLAVYGEFSPVGLHVHAKRSQRPQQRLYRRGRVAHHALPIGAGGERDVEDARLQLARDGDGAGEFARRLHGLFHRPS